MCCTKNLTLVVKINFCNSLTLIKSMYTVGVAIG